AKMDRTADAVQRLQDETFRLKGQVARIEEDMFQAEAKKCEGAGSVLIFKEGVEAESVRKLADAVMNTCQGCCAGFS
ncbi:alanyl-tRNA editing protein, partial [Blautia wexlerae]|nr:alanyl-tRNA editing protein [Blautia wexlerae]